MPTRLVADAVLIAALAVHAELLSRLRHVDGASPPWWFGYARDASNLAALLALWGAYLLLGFGPAVAFLAAALTTLTTYLLDWLIARGLKLRRARLFIALPLLGWALLVATRPLPIQDALEVLIAAVQPTR